MFLQVDILPITLHNGDSGSGIILFSYPHSEGILVKSIAKNSAAQSLVWPQDLIIRINENVSYEEYWCACDCSYMCLCEFYLPSLSISDKILKYWRKGRQMIFS